MAHPRPKPLSALRQFLEGQASSGIVLMVAAALALLLANSPAAALYAHVLHAPLGPLSVHHWVNDGLMAVFFLLVGLEIKREMTDGQLSTWPRRLLPGVAAAGGMAVPALVYLAFNPGDTARGWAIPAATDIAFALGVIALLGKRVPASLRVFLTALAIIDDLGAVIIIALFYTAQLSLPDLVGAGGITVALLMLNRLGVRRLSPYLVLGVVLWMLVLRSGIHATLAGVILALTIPMQRTPATPDAQLDKYSPEDAHDDSQTAPQSGHGMAHDSPLHRLEHRLHAPVGFVILPIFGLANAGVSMLGMSAEALLAPVTLGVALGLLAGKLIGVFASTMAAVQLGIADMPAHAGKLQLLGTALLCGIGFTMSLFITLLAFPGAPVLEAEAKTGILLGSLLSGVLGYLVLRYARRDIAPLRTPSQVPWDTRDDT